MKKQKNDYLEEVFAGTALVQANLSQAAGDIQQLSVSPTNHRPPSVTTRHRLRARVSGWGPWQSVVVPPNAFVVHTRRGQSEPVHCGMGISFRFNPYRDSFLIAPAAMQTIIVNASCISAERQGVMVQAYVQWIIDDFSRAYRKLDLSDQSDPMKVTNLQLQQQAEATIKDTVATMNIDEILSDKQPIIEVLTARLRAVAEGSDQNDDQAGLGLRIVTVQIKEAIVSSTTLWENLQRGFRAERGKEARLSELKAELIVQEEEAAAQLKMQRVNLEREEQVERLKREHEARTFDLEQTERARRAQLEAERAAESLQHERSIANQRAELAQLELQQEFALRQLKFEREMAELTSKLELKRAELELSREVTPAQLQQQLISLLPEIAEKLPKPDELRVYGDSGANQQMTRFVTEVTELIQRLGLTSTS